MRTYICAENKEKQRCSQSQDFYIYNNVQRQRCSRLVRLFKLEFLFSKRTRPLMEL
jgi:hypothetical protein